MAKIITPLLFIIALQIAGAQSYSIGTIDIYGNRKIPDDTIFSHLGIRAGDSISPQTFKRDGIAYALENIRGVKHAELAPVCCDTTGNLMIYVGIGEDDEGILKHRVPPTENLHLPDKMMSAYRSFGEQILPSIQNGQSDEDHSQGYALISYPPARAEQEKFIGFANDDFEILDRTLRQSVSDEDRAAAATIIAYSGQHVKVVDALLYAVDDPDESVRNNAVRALGILADYGQDHPNQHIHIPAGPFIELINSITWTDRNKGASVLMNLTQTRSPEILGQVKNQALPSIIEMAGWKDRGHAYFSFVILGRLAGVDDDTIFRDNISHDWKTSLENMIRKLQSRK